MRKPLSAKSYNFFGYRASGCSNQPFNMETDSRQIFHYDYQEVIDSWHCNFQP